MKFATVSKDGRIWIGVVIDDRNLINLNAVFPDLSTDMRDFVALGLAAMQQYGRRAIESGGHVSHAISSVRLLAPIPHPRKFLGIGLNYRAHAAEARRPDGEETKHQIWFNKQTSCVVGPYDPVWLPRVSDQMDYEGEMAVVIGRRCRHVRYEEAASVIAGFSICNDFSVRDWQARSPTATLGKSFDTHGPIGPFIVTPDEVGDPHRLELSTLVNGEKRQAGSTAEMVHDCYEQICELSRAFTLEPGDILATGTPAGVGSHMQPPVFLKVGDVVKVSVEKLGWIENTVIAEPDNLP